MLTKLLRLLTVVVITFALLQACAGCAVSKNKQSRTTVTDSLSKTTIRDSIIYHHRETEQGKDASQYERVTTITPTIIRDSNVIRVYPTTVITEKGGRVIEYRRDSNDSFMIRRLLHQVDSLSKVDKQSVKVKESDWPAASWGLIIVAGLLIVYCLYMMIKKPV